MIQGGNTRVFVSENPGIMSRSRLKQTRLPNGNKNGIGLKTFGKGSTAVPEQCCKQRFH